MDEITLTIPRRRQFFRIPHLVVGGLAVRLDVTFDDLQDLQVALEGILDAHGDDEITVRFAVEGDALRTIVGPYEEGRLEAALAREAGDDGLTLRRLLETVADEVAVRDEDGEEWIELRKTIRMVAA